MRKRRWLIYFAVAVAPGCGFRHTVEASASQHRERETLISSLLPPNTPTESAVQILQDVGFSCSKPDLQTVDCEKRLPRLFWIIPQRSRLRISNNNGVVGKKMSWGGVGWRNVGGYGWPTR